VVERTLLRLAETNKPDFYDPKVNSETLVQKHPQYPVILLASNSARRRQLMALGNWSFSAAASDVDESQRPGEAPGDYVLRLAEAKARAATGNVQPGQIIVAADTVVVDGQRILGKPQDAREALEVLRSLRGHTHKVYSGLAVLETDSGKLLTDLCITDVPMRNYSDEEIQAYVQTGDPLDKAGAYGIQNPYFQPVDLTSGTSTGFRGCFASVMGMPLCHLLRTLEKMGILPDPDVPANCQTYLHYQCPVSPAVLRGELVG
jgi:MAF protein